MSDSLPPPEALDLAQLRALDVLLGTASVTLAAQRCGTTQPAMSRTLAKLRAQLGDPLLVAVGRRMELTPRAQALRPRVQEALAAVRRVLAPDEGFSPGTERSTVRVAASDYGALVALAPWLEVLRREAPGVDVRAEPLGVDAVGRLVRGDLDLAITRPAPEVWGTGQLVSRPLLEDRFVCALRRGHPSSRGRFTLERYLALEHIMVATSSPGQGAVALALQRRGRERRVVFTVPSFLMAPAVIARTDLCATLPERLVKASSLPLITRPPPFTLEPLALHLVWHPRWTRDSRHRWLRERLAAAVPRRT